MSEQEQEYLTEEQSREWRARQRSRANVMALVLAGLAVLFFLITVVKIAA